MSADVSTEYFALFTVAESVCALRAVHTHIPQLWSASFRSVKYPLATLQVCKLLVVIVVTLLLFVAASFSVQDQGHRTRYIYVYHDIKDIRL